MFKQHFASGFSRYFVITRITVHGMFLCEPVDHLKIELHNDILYILCVNDILHLDFQDIL